jgi:hypothetical protein
MHDLAFADATRPTPVRVLKLRLFPYSIGHELLLMRDRNPFVLLTEEEFNKMPADSQTAAVVRAVCICCRDWNGNQTFSKFLNFWAWRIRNSNWSLAIAEFRNYLAEHRALLPTLVADVAEDSEAYQIANKGETIGDGRALGSPFLAQLINFVQQRKMAGDLDLKTFWDIPFALAANLYFTDLERGGNVYIENFREREEREAMAQHRADVKFERAAEAAAAQKGGN